MFKKLRERISAWLGTSPEPRMAEPDSQALVHDPDAQLEVSSASTAAPAPYDEHLFERSRTQWQFGDWHSLARLDTGALTHHPDRAKLALLAATAQGQLGNATKCRQLAKQALEWGCPKKLVSQVLIAGVHNALGRATAHGSQPQRALQHFEAALLTATPGADVRLLAPVLARNQFQQASSPAHTFANASEVAETEAHARAEQLLHRCLDSDDLHATTDEILDDPNLQPGICCLFMLKLAETFAAKKDSLTATHYLRQSRHYFDAASPATQTRFLQLLVRIGRADEAADITMSRALQGQAAVPVDDATAKAIRHSYEQVRTLQGKQAEHGHDLLLDWLKYNLPQLAATETKRVLIEIGTTREDVPGQGSTAKLAKFCASNGLDFITVDMDPHNTHMARALFARNQLPFTAVTEKGEDYLRQYNGRMDFVFLDAYDFDHGKHSELRQSRYVQMLGSRIDEQACHQMHLDCAESVLQKLAPDGVVCIDDTWQGKDHKWTAKGTLAMPYLLEKGYALIEARNRAALLKPPVADL